MRKLITFLLLATPFAFSASAFSSEPVFKKGVFPTYPSCAIEKRVQGTVRIKAVLNSDGRVIRAIPIDNENKEVTFPELKNDAQFAYECLCQAAQKAALAWEFGKGSKAAEVMLSFRFELVSSIPNREDLYPIILPPSKCKFVASSPSYQSKRERKKVQADSRK